MAGTSLAVQVHRDAHGPENMPGVTRGAGTRPSAFRAVPITHDNSHRTANHINCDLNVVKEARDNLKKYSFRHKIASFLFKASFAIDAIVMAGMVGVGIGSLVGVGPGLSTSLGLAAGGAILFSSILTTASTMARETEEFIINEAAVMMGQEMKKALGGPIDPKFRKPADRLSLLLNSGFDYSEPSGRAQIKLIIGHADELLRAAT